MKKITSAILFSLFVLVCPAFGTDLAFQQIPLNGRWQPGLDPATISDGGFQDIQNMRRFGNHYRGVNGMDDVSYTVTVPIDYDRLVESDAGNYITSDADSKTITATGMPANATAYIREAYGALFGLAGSEDFEVRFRVNFTGSADNTSGAYVWAMANSSANLDGITDFMAVSAKRTSSTKFSLTLTEKTGAATSYTVTITDFTQGTDYYVKVYRDMSLGNGYGRLYFRVYSDVAFATPVSAAWAINLHEANYFGYIFGMSAMTSLASADTVTITTNNLSYNNYTRNSFNFYKDSSIVENANIESWVLTQGERKDQLSHDNRQQYVFAYDAYLNGAWDSSPLYTEATAAQLGRFSPGPGSTVLFADGKESCVWGGDYGAPTAFLASAAAVTTTVTSQKDFTAQVWSTSSASGDVAVVGNPNDSATVTLLHMDGTDASTTFTDSSSAAHTWTASGSAALDTDQIKFGTASGLFDGSGDYISSADSADWYMATGDFTIDFWFRLADDTDIHQIFKQYVDASNYAKAVYYYAPPTPANPQLYFEIQEGGNQNLYLGAYISPLAANEWHHVAIIRGWGGSSTTAALCLDGVMVDTSEFDSAPNNDWPDFAAAFTVGDSSAYAMNGWIDEFRISKGVARWTADFTPPQSAYGAAYNYWLVGATRPLQGVYYDLSGTNQTTATLTAQEWAGTAWSSISVTDGTSGLSEDGAVTWASTVNTSKPRYLAGDVLYWYQFALSAGNATIAHVTVDAPFQKVPNIPAAEDYPVAACFKYTGSVYQDYTDEITSELDSDVMDLDGLTTSGYVLLGFTQPMQAFLVDIPNSKENGTAGTTLTVEYWDGDSWEDELSLLDGTASGTTALARSGAIAFQPPAKGIEFETAINETAPLYYYRLAWGDTLDAEVEIYQVRGIPATYPLRGYSFPAMFQGRALFLDEYEGQRNKAVYSAYNQPDVFNGSDSGELYFGGGSKVVAAAPMYNVFGDSGSDMLIVCKENETYRVFGEGPSTWRVELLSGSIGCSAPLSMAMCDVRTDSGARQVLIWQSQAGVVMCDGGDIQTISDDIKNYFDPNSDDRVLESANLGNSRAWYDSKLRVYKLLVETYGGDHYDELEYSLDYNEWTRLYRENTYGHEPLASGVFVSSGWGDDDSYGFTEGRFFHLETGTTWNDTLIEEYLWTKDYLFGGPGAILFGSTVDYFRLFFDDKDSDATMTVTHYCNRAVTTDGTSNQEVPSAISFSSGPIYTQSCMLGPCDYHSFKLSTSTEAVGGMEPMSIGVAYDVITNIVDQEN